MNFQEIIADKPKRSLSVEIFAVIFLVLITGIGLWQTEPREYKQYDREETFIDAWRTKLQERIELVFVPPVSPWVSGLLLGDDSGFSREWKEVFRRTGTSHLTAVSGYNVSVIFGIVSVVTARLPFGRRARVLSGLSAVTFFVLITGAPASVLRAAVMAGAVLLAKEAGRPVKPLRAMLLAVLVLVAIDPPILTTDLGFQLSVMATFGLVTLSGPISAMLGGLPSVLREWSGQTIAATLTVAPIIAFVFGSYSLVALPANLAVMIFIPFIMAVGAALIVIGFVFLPLAQFIAGFGHSLFGLPLIILRFFSAFPISLLYGPAAFAVMTAIALVFLYLLFRWWSRAGDKYFL